ncbi:flagellar basal-body MS-ring/collar protein FliF [Achromobacter deleyi]|uniref:flagellar basal-body MS-ring/collar protein FliF n=1 Tax=Achromobacter deleyi TaxID=1353891 RepID=UPI001490F46A|nr:flagellar basal-body MS-ring/collar protein FliF [Achromobacter deleyi]QVQ26144.1 flagellar M-ring protein FliF [Achromobacter deleyi]UIP21705.1 flagellar M-ring protein FliF [Achromobacter deleyi]
MAFSEFWTRLDRRNRYTLAFGAVAIVAAVAIAGFWLTRGNYQVLFSGIKPQDASVMLSELDKQKIPYRLEADGTAILVPQEVVHKTRIGLLGQDLPLHGAVGFELFNNADFGMTEFAQRINYQRALQGEITRTILSLSNVESARVLIALPEQGLFHRGGGVPTASIAVALRDGRSLTPEQVLGIQRLVSASIPDIESRNVTIVNQHGVALTASGEEGDGAGAADARLALKRSTEEYLTRKISGMLDQTFGAGTVVASVDVLLNMDRIRITTEDILPYSPSGKGQPTGVVVRERRSNREGESGVASNSRRAGGGTESETDYQAGRKVEEIVSTPGVIMKMGVTAVVRGPMDGVALDRLRMLVGNAAGAQVERGDTVIVYSTEQMAARGAALAQDAGLTVAQAPPPALRTEFEWTPRLAISLLLAAGGVLVMLLLLLSSRRAQAPRLSAEQREVLLQQLRGWLAPAKSGADVEKS